MGEWFSRLAQRYWLAAAAGGCLLPFVALAFYSHPALDDYAIGGYLRTRSMMAYVAEVYGHNSGRYASALSSVVLKYNALHPAAYQWLVLAGLLALVAGLYAAAAATVPAGARQLALPVGSVLLVTCLLGLPKPADGIYWLTGEVSYLYPVALVAGLVALLAWLAAHPGARGRPLAWVAAVALAAYVPGFSEITALLLPLVAAGSWVAVRPRRLAGGWLAVAAAIAAGSLLTLLTPAHHEHWQPATQPLVVLRTGASAALHTAQSMVSWAGNGLLPLWLLLALPLSVAYTRAAQERNLLQRLTHSPWLWPLLTLGGLWISFFFYQLATQDGVVPRVRNLLYLYFVAGSVLSSHAAFRRLPPRYRELLLAPGARVGLVAALAVGLLTGPHAVGQAYRDWLGGAARRYDRQQQARVARVRAARPGTGPLRFDPLQTRPVSLFYQDISPNPAAWTNVGYAAFWYCPVAVYVAPAPAR